MAAGTVTLLFTDIEGSSALWEQDGAHMSRALAAHDALARRAVESRHGTVVKMTGDGMHAVFDAAVDALAATLDMQHALADPAATHGLALRVRCGLHAGMVERRDNDYFGSAVNRAARIMSAAHGGQMLLSEAVADGVREMLPAAVALRDLGKVRLKDLATPERTVRQRHRDYFLALAEESAPQLSGAEQALWLQRLDEEHDNLRAALEWSRAGAGAEPGLRLAGALIWFWSMRGHLAEGREWCARVLALAGPEERTPARARALNAAGTLAWYQADYAAARARHEAALAIWRELGERAGVGRSLNNLGLVAWDQGDYPLATALTEESLAMERELGNAGLIARSLNNLGLLAYEQGDYAAAWALHQESLAMVRQLGDKSGIAASLNNLGEVAFARGDHPAGRALYQDSLALMRELGDKSGIANVLNNLGGAASAQGDYGAALPLLEEALALMRELGERSGIATSLNTLGSLAFEQGDVAAALALNRESLAIRHELGERRAIAGTLEGVAEGLSARGEPLQAARLWGAAERLREALGSPSPPNERPRYERQVAAARAALTDARAFAASWQQGRALALERAIELALQDPQQP
jgi:class 3 adenylate cyclase